jgi:hypothetical protein
MPDLDEGATRDPLIETLPECPNLDLRPNPCALGEPSTKTLRTGPAKQLRPLAAIRAAMPTEAPKQSTFQENPKRRTTMQVVARVVEHY